MSGPYYRPTDEQGFETLRETFQGDLVSDLEYAKRRCQGVIEDLHIIHDDCPESASNASDLIGMIDKILTYLKDHQITEEV